VQYAWRVQRQRVTSFFRPTGSCAMDNPYARQPRALRQMKTRQVSKKTMSTARYAPYTMRAGENVAGSQTGAVL